ncbi:D-3-phosphoglycerate dehydrogenase/2-oxoglutarate reductase [Enterococcus sp. AZ135]|uniref:2-hydroxyacid dehydrogenase n=1 Tax=unclassified Enterococcus TaxID=2608891 RepID=UPI003F245F57
MKVLYLEDETVTREVILETTKNYRNLLGDVEIAVFNESMGNSKEAIADSILKTEKNGPEWLEPSQELLAAVKDADVLVTHFVGVNQAIIDAAKKLRLICILRSGIENVNVAYAKEQGIPVVNAPGRLAGPVADYSVGMIIAESRNMVRSNLQGTKGKWVIRFDNFSYSQSLADKVVGIIGFGLIGREVTKRLIPFGTTIKVYDPFYQKTGQEGFDFELVGLDDLLTEADFVSMHARLTKETEGLFGAAEFNKMKKTAFFVNTARAGLVDEPALIAALQAKDIGGAALDVFANEPLPADNPLLALDNVTLTPHLAGTASNVGQISLRFIEPDLKNFVAGKALVNRVG